MWTSALTGVGLDHPAGKELCPSDLLAERKGAMKWVVQEGNCVTNLVFMLCFRYINCPLSPPFYPITLYEVMTKLTYEKFANGTVCVGNMNSLLRQKIRVNMNVKRQKGSVIDCMFVSSQNL